MLTKFETKSNRVKGLTFHPKRPWILASLHSGVIQLWDYRMGTLIDRFDEHEGPVRGIDFHNSQPLFVSGGDDYKIKVWSYKLRRCLFTLLGHLDYIRTVEFHPEYAWIVSASDDQTIRIWNWQSRNSIAVLTGHNHYVMCARFHHKDDLIVSASLDQTVRVWDISGLRRKVVSPMDERMPQMNNDLFGGGDTAVKYILEGHDRGVNWAAFHPTLPLVVSGADDRQVKLWRMNDTKAWEVDSLRGHVNNVSCVAFHAKQDVIISNSEDKSIRVWDMSKRVDVQTFRREQDRFWILATHPEVNLLAAGHDSGMIVFKLERERPAFTSHQSNLFYVKDRYLRCYDFQSQRDNPLVSIRRTSGGLNSNPRSMSYNPAENAVLVTYDAGGDSYELFMLPKDGGRGEVVGDSRRGEGTGAVFVARNRFAVLDKQSNNIIIKNLDNEMTKKCASPVAGTDNIFYAGTGSLLCRADDKMVLFDLQQRAAVAELATPFIKYVVWSSDMSRVALLSKHAIVLADKKLGNAVTIHETIRVKSGAWDDHGVFIYTTLNHIKYGLPNGDSGIIRTLDNPIYLTKVFGNIIYCLDRDGRNRQIQFDSSEYMFKLALNAKRFDHVLSMIKSGQLCGQSIIAYLQQKGYPEIALHFVQDERTRFELALECGNIEVALGSAQEIDDTETWHKLGVAALNQGNHQIVEFAYQKTKNFERLSFLYLITGNMEKLSKMLKISEMRADVMGQFHNALYLGNVAERVKVLESVGHYPLAYLTAKTHGLEDDASRLAEILTESGSAIPDVSGLGKLLQPPAPLLRGDNWPLLPVSKGFFEGMLAGEIAGDAYAEDDSAMGDAGLGWGDADIDIGEDERIDPLAMAGIAPEDDVLDIDNENDGWGMDDLEVPDELMGDASGDVAGDDFYSDVFVAPTAGVPQARRWTEKSGVAGEHVAAGDFDSAMKLLSRQLGIVNFEPLKQLFVDLAYASHASVEGMPAAPRMSAPLGRGWTSRVTGVLPPAMICSPAILEQRLKAAFKMTTEGKFVEAVKAFVGIIHAITLLSVEEPAEVDQVFELLNVARNYACALRIEIARKEVKDDPARQAELAAYFTHAQMQPIHLSLSLRSAMSTFFKLKNYVTAATFCRRLLELNPPVQVAQQAKQVLQACERAQKDEVEVNYDSHNPFVVCAATFVPIYKGTKDCLCPTCGAHFVVEQAGNLCSVCNLGKIGADATGLVCSTSQAR